MYTFVNLFLFIHGAFTVQKNLEYSFLYLFLAYSTMQASIENSSLLAKRQSAYPYPQASLSIYFLYFWTLPLDNPSSFEMRNWELFKQISLPWFVHIL